LSSRARIEPNRIRYNVGPVAGSADRRFAQALISLGSVFMMRASWFRCGWLVAVLVIAVSVAGAQTSPQTPDIPAKYEAPAAAYDYVKRAVMIPMRDGVKLHTVIIIPRRAKNAPIILTRTPYHASKRAERISSTHMLAILSQGDEVFVADGYIRVFQDVRGKYGSEGEYFMTRPLRGPLNSSDTDHSTDAYDTIDWLVKNVPESNGQGGNAGQLLRGFHRGNGPGESAPRVEGGCAHEPDGRWLDGRRLVPLRRIPPDKLRLLHLSADAER
jgi:hypothetical protein